MNRREALTALTGLADRLIDRPDGVATMELIAEFKETYGDALPDLSVDIVDDWLHRTCKDIVTKAGRGRVEQLTLPGMGTIEAFVTVPDGEGDFRRKKLIYASEPDLDADELIHEQNVTAAERALDHTRRRNRMIRRVMREQGFGTAGPAIDWLNDQDGDKP